MGKREYFMVVGAVFLAFVLCIGLMSPEAIQTGAWGLHFSENGSFPSGPASVQQLAQRDAAYVDTGNHPVLYLTFDAGYENGHTEKILEILRKHEVKAAFFLVGNYLEKNQDLVRTMVGDGHIVGNHTMHHPDMTKLTDPQAFRTELESLETLYTQVTGQTMAKFYRPPQGLYSDENLKQAQALGYKTVFWSLAYADWDNAHQPSREQALEKLLGRTHNGAVILLHSTSQTNAEILDELLTRWKELGYHFQTLDALFA